MKSRFNLKTDTISADGSILRLHELLADEFKRRKEGQVGARLHLLHNITDQTSKTTVLPTRKSTTARNSIQDRGSKTASSCLIGRISATTALR